MATTEPRTGFRLPWSADHRSEAETLATGSSVLDGLDAPTSAHPETEQPTDAVVETTEAPTSAEPGWPDTGAPESDAAGSTEAPLQMQADRPADLADLDEARHEADAAPATPTTLEAEAALEIDPEPTPLDLVPAAAPTAPSSPATQRPVKFLADLTRAMQAAAEEARSTTLAQVHADSKSCIERIHTVSAEEASDLKRRSDDDVSAIRDRSKAEIARIREETEGRIAGRKVELEGQLESHAALIERRIDFVQRRVTAFETEMEAFFQRLSQEGDPTLFASLAESLPEPPVFEEAVALLELESAPTTTGGSLEASDAVDQGPIAAEPGSFGADLATIEAGDAGETPDTAEIEAEAADTVETGGTVGSLELEAEAADSVEAAGTETESTAAFEAPEMTAGPGADLAVGDADATTAWTYTEPTDEQERDAAMAAIQAAAEAADRGVTDTTEPAADAEGAGEATADAAAWTETDAPGDGSEPTAEAPAEPEMAAIPVSDGSEPGAPEAFVEPAEEVQTWPASIGDEGADPRLTALSLTPDYAKAEAAAVVDAASSEEQITEIGEESLAARLADLVPGTAEHSPRPAPPVPGQRTQVVVVGLVSVASIASFKRQLGRVPGVQNVGVSSGPDGEFVFSVAHGDELSLRDVIPTLPGFQARVLNAGEGIVNVSARDPEGES
ncbi:MAG: hypothetical protein ACXWMX_00070 [Candidatus Limnocylindrales bacterium]